MAESKIFKGRPALPGAAESTAVVSHIGFNTCATYVDVLISGSDSGVCQDHDNPDLFQQDLQDKILCIPQTIGSSSAATLLMIVMEKGIGPKAILFANHIDSLAACGLLMADNWMDKRTITVDLLGDDFLNTVKTGDTVAVHEDGTVVVTPA